MYFLQGFIIGLAYVAPIGLQNLFVINTAISQSKKRLYLTAFIIIFFDITLALACFFGIGAIMETSDWLKLVVLFVGSILVIWIGLGLIRAKGNMDSDTNVNIPISKVISTACIVTWFNPQALIDGTMLLGAFKATLPQGEDLFFILGVNAASIIWFLGISTIVSFFRKVINNKALRIINIVCGVIIIIYGLKLGYNFIEIISSIF